LSKKNEAGGENGEFPTPPPPVTSKPEVFFVKYNNKEEADSAVSKIQESFQEGGPGYQSPASFAQSIGAQSGGSAQSSSFSSGGGGSSGGFGGSSGGGGGGSFGASSGGSGSVSFGGSSGGGASFGGSSFGGSSGSSSGSSGSGYSSGGNFIQSQQMIELPIENTVFNDYLPPNRRY
jgi:hypothetical protein